MASHFSNSEWQKIHALFDQSAERFGFPESRADSVIIGSFNIRKLGAVAKRTAESWDFLHKILARYDLIAVQEIMDDLSGFEHLHAGLGGDYGMVVSDITGSKPGSSGNAERLGYLFNWRRVQRTALASDITYDRSEITRNLYDNRSDFSKAWAAHTKKLKAWESDAEEHRAEGKRAPSRPGIELPRFVSFIRQPHCVSFRIPGAAGSDPYEIIVVNAHLLYGDNKQEREWEFRALIEWLTLRAKYIDKLYHKNLLLLGDCNLDFDSVPQMREQVDSFLKGLNASVLKSKKAAVANFPMLSAHPQSGILRTALRQGETYDQIGLFANDPRLPTPEANKSAGDAPGNYDYGVFNIADLIATALHDKPIAELPASKRKAIYRKSEYDISDHMPIWLRLPLPS